MVSVQANCSLSCALTRLQSIAHRNHQSIDEIATAVVDGRKRFGQPSNSIRPHRTSN
jgi:hypothetical protein